MNTFQLLKNGTSFRKEKIKHVEHLFVSSSKGQWDIESIENETERRGKESGREEG